MALSASLGVLLDHTQDKIVLLDETGRFTYLNDAVTRILGWEPGSLLGQNAFDYIHPNDVVAARDAFERTIGSTSFTETTLELRYLSNDGSWVWVESRMSNLTDESLDGYVVSSRDISDRKAAEQEQRETASRLRELSATTGEVLWMFDGDFSELLFLNPAYEDVYGRPVAAVEADAEAFLDAIHPADTPMVREAMSTLAAGDSVDMEYRVNPDRNYGVWVWVQAEPIIEDGEVVRITGFSRDVTDRYRRERQLAVMDKLLRHNIRNDLNVILGHAELIESEVPDVAEKTAVIRQTGENLLASAEKEREIIDLLTGSVAPGTLDLASVIETAVEAISAEYPEASIEGPELDPVFVNGIDELGIAFVELLENALVHAEHEDPTVTLETRDVGTHLVVTVIDRGPPIPDVEANVLTGDHEMTDIYHSTGLGLWLVYWIVSLSDGHITVERPESTGNRIRVHLSKDTS